MSYKHIADAELLKMAACSAASIRERTLELLMVLTEIDRRKLYCDLSYSSLFIYIVVELKFCESQAALYNNIIKSNILDLPQTRNKIENGNLSLFAAGAAARIIRKEKISGPDASFKVLKKFEGMTKEEIRKELPIKAKKSELNLSKAVLDKIESLKKKLNLPSQMEAEEIFNLLLDLELTKDHSAVKENKTMTPKTKSMVKVAANHQCSYVACNNIRCQETKYLEVDHIQPKSLGGSNHPNNLRILCRNHNQRAAIVNLGQHSISKRTSPAK